MILIAVLRFVRQREDLPGDLPSPFPGAKPFRACQSPQVCPPPRAGRAPQSALRYSAHPSPWLTCSCICYPLFTYITPARPQCQPGLFPRAAQPLALARLGDKLPSTRSGWGHPDPPPRQAHGVARESWERSLQEGSVQRGAPQQPPPAKCMRGGDLFYSVWLVPD